MVHNAAVPTVVDAAGRRLGVVVLAQRHSRNEDPGEAQDYDQRGKNSLQSLSLSGFALCPCATSLQSFSFFFGQLFKH
jgi:hypothetical protein